MFPSNLNRLGMGFTRGNLAYNRLSTARCFHTPKQRKIILGESFPYGEALHGIPDKSTVAGKFLEIEKESMAQTIQLQSLEGKVDKGFDRLNYIIVGIVGTSLFGLFWKNFQYDVVKQANSESRILESVRLIVAKSEADILLKMNEHQKAVQEKLIDQQKPLDGGRLVK